MWEGVYNKVLSFARRQALVPFWDACSSLIQILPDDNFPGLDLAKVDEFAGVCRQRMLMVQRGEQVRRGRKVPLLYDRLPYSAPYKLCAE